MKLKEYNEKRNFEKTSEPIGKIKNTKGLKRFVVQYHRATKKHFDFRLEFGGVLVSFAIPKDFPKQGEKRLAVHVEDHPIDYINFEGTIPKGEYGAGTVEIFDRGFYKTVGSFKKGFADGKIKFFLFGEKLSGLFNLIKMDEKNWLIIKDKQSVEDNQIKEIKTQSKKCKNPFNKVDVKLCLLTKTVPKNKDYIFEIKYDGYRIVAFLSGKKVVLKSRNNQDYSEKFLVIKQELEKTNKTMVLDGEIVVFDEKGKSDFGMLQNAIKSKRNNFCYVVFDILALNGKDLRDLSLKKRKILLDKNLTTSKNIILSEFVKENGQKVFSFAKKNNLEGIVAKNVNSVYNDKRDNDWLKIKCYLRQEFVIIGFKTSEKNKVLSAIYVGFYKDNELYFVGKVGTGFSEKLKKELVDKFEKIKTNKLAIKNFDIKEDICFLKPKLVAEVQYSNITQSKKLRQASFVGLREDKNPKQVFLEQN